MPITIRKTTKINIVDSIIRVGKKEKEQPKRNYAQKVKIETKSSTIKVLK